MIKNKSGGGGVVKMTMNFPLKNMKHKILKITLQLQLEIGNNVSERK
jgi:hypothetical protein